MTTARSWRADVFPALVAVSPAGSPAATTLTPADPDGPGKTLDRVRVVVTADRVMVFTDSSKGPTAVLSERILDYTPPPAPRTLRNRDASRTHEHALTLASGKTLAFRRGSGCGCGSRLRSFNPAQDVAQASAASTRDA